MSEQETSLFPRAIDCAIVAHGLVTEHAPRFRYQSCHLCPIRSDQPIPRVTTMTGSDGNPGPPIPPERELCSVPAVRLDERGDINRSYSADLIATSGRVRKPFPHLGQFWVCTSISGSSLTRSGYSEHEAYRLAPERAFVGVPTSYGARTGTAEASEAARNDPYGFYNGIAVKHGSEAFVMSGPPRRFIADKAPSRPKPDTPEPMQLTLF